MRTEKGMRIEKHVVRIFILILSVSVFAVAFADTSSEAQAPLQVDAVQDDGGAESAGSRHRRKHLLERETFGGNGRTYLTCHSRKTRTVSPEQAQKRFAAHLSDPLFVHDGSDDGLGNGVTRMLDHATTLVEIPLPPSQGEAIQRSCSPNRTKPTSWPI